MTLENLAIIGLINPKSPANVGAILRASGCFQAHAVRYTGNRWERGARFHTDTQNISQELSLSHESDLWDGLPEGTQVVCVDLVEGATPLPEFQHPAKAMYVFGPEDGSIEQALVDRADHVVYIPTIGCLNLAATANVVLYDRLAKSDSALAGDELIRTSRDRNNNTKV